jgi:hypothetical protein
VLTSNDKGNIAEAAIALEAIKLGIEVLRPVAEHGRYDLAFDLGNQILPGAMQVGAARWSCCLRQSGGLPLDERRQCQDQVHG